LDTPVFFLISAATLLSQILPFRNYAEKNGLPSPIVCYIIQDSRGYLWMGTDNGLSRFDGSEFKNYQKTDGLPDNKINVILADRQGKLWIGTEKGCISGFFDNLVNPARQNIFPGRSVYSIIEDRDGKLWFATSRGISCFDGKIFRHLTTTSGLPSEKIYTIAMDRKGKPWIGTGRGLFYYENEKFISFTTDAGLMDQFISTLLCDSDGNLWIGTQRGLYSIREGKPVLYTRKDGLCDDSVTALREDRSGNIWIGTWNGVSLFSRGKFANYSTINGLPHNFIYSITQDCEGNIWFGTEGGAGCLTSLNIKTYTKDHGLPTGMIMDIIQDKKGRYWIGTPEGLSCYSGANFINYTKKDGLISNTINALMADHHGNIWVATIEGLSILSPGFFANYTEKDGLASKILFKSIESRDGTIWIGSSKGLTRFRNGKFSPPSFPLKQGQVICLMEDTRGNLWFSSREKLNKYSGNHLTTFSTRDGLPGNKIEAIVEDSKGKIWICSGGGLTCYDKGTFTHYSTGNSELPDNACYCIVEDTHGDLWIGNSKGLACFDGKRFKNYPSERLALTDRKWSIGIKDNHGSLWFGTTEGVVNFYPPPVSTNTTPPPIYFTGLKVMEKEIPLPGNNQFAHNRNIFRFNFIGLSFSDPGGIEYKYRLENIDTDWQTTKDHSLFYPFLPPGSYSLKVKAVNSDGIESETPAEYRFKILPPFWHTWWFLVLLGLVFGGFLLLVLQWRVRRAREKAELKTKQTELDARNRQLVISQRMELMGFLAAGTVHDLKNLLSVIIGYSRLMSQKYQGDNEDHQNIEVIKDTAATAVQMAKQILSFARHKDYAHGPVELGSVLIEILDTLKIIQPKNIRVLRDIQAEPVFFPIHPARFQQVVMNLCLNAFHAMPEGGQLRVALASAADVNNEITLEISDTGNTGIKPEHLDKIFEPFFTTKEQGQGSGLGLFVVKQIVEEYQGKIEVHSEPGQGTRFVIRFSRCQETKTQRDFNV
jgi:ligand-binding sensor domain-containing protein/signal transduction histidine kinase